MALLTYAPTLLRLTNPFSSSNASAVSTSGISIPLRFATASTPLGSKPTPLSTAASVSSRPEGRGWASPAARSATGTFCSRATRSTNSGRSHRTPAPSASSPFDPLHIAHAWRTGHGPYIASCVEGVASCYEGSALLGRLDDHHSPGKPGYDAVSGGKAPCQGRLAQVVLGDQGPMVPDGLEEAPVAPGVDDHVSISVQTASRSIPRTSRSPFGETRTCRRSIR